MAPRIIYLNDENKMVVLIPALDCGLTITEIANKDVPAGKPYKLVDSSTLPADRAGRDTWAVDAGELTDGVGGGA